MATIIQQIIVSTSLHLGELLFYEINHLFLQTETDNKPPSNEDYFRLSLLGCILNVVICIFKEHEIQTLLFRNALSRTA